MGTLGKRKLNFIEPEMPKYAKARISRRRRFSRRRRTYRSKKVYMKRRYARTAKRRTVRKKFRTLPETKTIMWPSADDPTNHNVGLYSTGTSSGHQFHYTNFFPTITQMYSGNTRIGNTITPISSRITMRIKGQSAQTEMMQYRIMIIQKQRDTMANFDITDFLEKDNMAAGQPYSTASRRDTSGFREYRVLYNKLFTAQQDSFSGNNFNKDITILLRHKGNIRYENSDGIGTDAIEYGDFGMLVLANAGTTGSNTGLTYTFRHQLYYIDP